MTRAWILGCAALVPLLLGAGPPVVKSTAPAPDIDALFERTDGWIGADGVYSVALSSKRTLWLFSDTWVGKIRDGRRTDATIVNNTVGVQEAIDKLVNYTIARGPDDKPKALIVPADGHGWFWLQAGVADHNRLSLFLNKIEKTDDKSVFGFRSVGIWLGTVADADKPPESWHVEQVKLPNTIHSKDRTLSWGAAVLRVGDDLYIYGTDERHENRQPTRQLVVARVPAASVGDFAAWRYYRGDAWDKDFHSPSLLAPDFATEFSVTPFGKRFLAVYTEKGLSPRIMGRVADHPWGSWSPPTVLYECPEMNRDKKLFCYSGKAQPTLSSSQDLVISYVVNSFDFWQVAREAKLYWPRFVRVKLVTSE